MTRRLSTLLVLVALLAACGGGDDDARMVWCVGPTETVDAEFKREYPELYMPEKVCEAWR